METLALCFVSLVGGYIIGSFLPSYFKKKGENLATKEDIAELTKTAKEIEASINEGVSSRQREWEFKREALLEGGRAVADFLAAVMRLNAIYATKAGASPDEETQYLLALNKHETDALDAVNKASYTFQRAQLILSIVSGKEVQIAFVKTEKLYKAIAVKITEGDTDYLTKALPQLRQLGSNLTMAMRRELGFDDSEFTPEST